MESELGPRGSVLKPGESLVGRKGVLPLHFLEGPTGSQAVALGAQRPAAAPFIFLPVSGSRSTESPGVLEPWPHSPEEGTQSPGARGGDTRAWPVTRWAGMPSTMPGLGPECGPPRVSVPLFPSVRALVGWKT